MSSEHEESPLAGWTAEARGEYLATHKTYRCACGTEIGMAGYDARKLVGLVPMVEFHEPTDVLPESWDLTADYTGTDPALYKIVCDCRPIDLKVAAAMKTEDHLLDLAGARIRRQPEVEREQAFAYLMRIRLGVYRSPFTGQNYIIVSDLPALHERFAYTRKLPVFVQCPATVKYWPRKEFSGLPPPGELTEIAPGGVCQPSSTGGECRHFVRFTTQKGVLGETGGMATASEIAKHGAMLGDYRDHFEAPGPTGAGPAVPRRKAGQTP
jgi:hypothetical protein